MNTLLHPNDRGIQSAQDQPDAIWSLSDLIRSRTDALIVYRNADWFDSEETTSEYRQLGILVDKWGTPEFTNLNAERMDNLVAEMVSKRSCFLNNEYDGMGYGLADALLQALVEAAKANTETVGA